MKIWGGSTPIVNPLASPEGGVGGDERSRRTGEVERKGRFPFKGGEWCNYYI